MRGFIYIVSNKTYYNYVVSRGKMKYVPKFLLPMIDRKISSKEISEIKYGDRTVGYAVGISILDSIEKENFEKRLSKIINKLNIDEIISIITEDNKKLQLNYLSVEHKTINKIDMSLYLEVAPYIIDFIFKILQKDFNAREVLIITSKKINVEKLIRDLSSYVKFISLYHDDINYLDTIEAKIIQEIGLSVSTFTNISKIKRYDYIINISDDMIFSKYIKDRTIIFNLSKAKHNENGKGIIVDDFIFKKPTQLKSTDKIIKVNKEVPFSIYSIKGNYNTRDFIKLEINNSLYSVEEMCDLFIKGKKKVRNLIIK